MTRRGQPVGPAHRGVYRRKAGSAPHFRYSSAVRNATVVWEDNTLDAWLTNPHPLIGVLPPAA